MFITTRDYLKRITNSLELVVAPEIESDFIRGQVLAAVFLLDQLAEKVDYKPGLIDQEIAMDRETLAKIAEAFNAVGVEAPDEAKAILDESAAEPTLNLRNQCDQALSIAIENFFQNRAQLSPEDALELDGHIVAHFKKISLRNLGMFRPSTSGKLIQKKK